ncbi:MAG: ABC transporter ATP-binding protein, partial [Solobacterium sp.]|nr:ABC transporter ATP-binding protein [Solobacterium sp.]
PATLLALLPFGVSYYMKGSVTAPDLLMLIILSLGLIPPFVIAASYMDDMSKLGTIVGEVTDILEKPELVRPDTMTGQPQGTEIRLRDVHFAYKEEEVLHGVDLTIQEGTVNALVGPSGSGKSTIAKLIASFWDVGSGSITFGGVDIRKIPLDDYQKMIAYVSQDNYLFDMSVMENIRLGNPKASDEEVMEAAKACGCHAFILGLENGYQTNCGGSGSHLSGGERQRISIARAMMKDAPVIFLDEATANVDPENENDLMQAIEALTREKTVVMIAHRLKTVEHADQILVVDHGKIVQRGRHEDLMKQEGIYRNFVSERREAAGWKVRNA